MKLVAVVALAAVAAALTQKDVDAINSMPGVTWTASLDSPTAHLTRDEAKRLLGSLEDPNYAKLPKGKLSSVGALPTAFDAWEKWPSCASMKQIRDQSDCGSCWAIAAAEAFSDRMCIKNGVDYIMSTEDVNSCSSYVTDCGSCNGGTPSCAWGYWYKTGVVLESCAPYSLPGCDHHIENSSNPCPDIMYPTPRCPATCTVSGQSWKKYFAAESPKSFSGELAIQNELYTNGPLEVSFSVYEDFLTYTSGIYHHLTGAYDGGHAVKVVGWGVENGVNFWRIANSWNSHWGEQGFFRIRRGNNECGIEGSGVAALAAAV